MPNRFPCRRSTSRCLLLLVVTLSLFSQPALADYAVQVGIYKTRYYADELITELKESGYPVVTLPLNRSDGSVWLRIAVGPYPQFKLAEDALAELKAAGHDGFVRKYTRESAAVLAPESSRPNQTPALPDAESVSPAVSNEGALPALPPGSRPTLDSEAEKASPNPGAEMPAADDRFSLDGIGANKPSR